MPDRARRVAVARRSGRQSRPLVGPEVGEVFRYNEISFETASVVSRTRGPDRRGGRRRPRRRRSVRTGAGSASSTGVLRCREMPAARAGRVARPLRRLYAAFHRSPAAVTARARARSGTGGQVPGALTSAAALLLRGASCALARCALGSGQRLKRCERAAMGDDLLSNPLPILTDFAAAARPENYRPVPDDWVVGYSDVVGSTRAISEGRYKAVNFVGAGVVAAVSNALRRRPFPFVFGGDGASFAVAAEDAAAAADALARDRRLRQGRVRPRIARGDRSGRRGPRRRTRRQGRPLRRLQGRVYAMFAGGGLTWVEERAKAGDFAVPPAPPGRASRSLGPLLPLGRGAGEARRRPVGDRHSARRRTRATRR